MEEIFWGYPKKNDALFLTLMDVMNCIIETNGRNEYELGHHSRLDKHHRPGTDVPAVLFVTAKAIEWDFPPASYLSTDTETEENSVETESFELVDL